MKTIHDVSLEEWGELAESAEEILGLARFNRWLNAEHDEDDGSYAKTCKRMERALSAIGLPQCTEDEFYANLKEMLTSGLIPEQWRALKDVSGPKM